MTELLPKLNENYLASSHVDKIPVTLTIHLKNNTKFTIESFDCIVTLSVIDTDL